MPVRFSSRLRIYLWRVLVRLNTYLNLRWSSNPPPKSSFTKTISVSRGTISILFYTPKHYLKQDGKYPLVINFHGGGGMMGTPEEDARWFEAVTTRGAVVASVNYRLMPEYPYPVAFEDSVAAVRWMMHNASSIGVDPKRTLLSGFSFGASLIFPIAMAISKEDTGKVLGLISVYPSVDRSLSRVEKFASNSDAVENKSLNLLFDEAYNLVEQDLQDHRVSPAKASDNDLQKLPPSIGLWTAELDPLLKEAEDFRRRLQRLGKNMLGGIVRGRPHYWDKKPSYRSIDEQRERWHAEASGIAQDMWGS